MQTLQLYNPKQIAIQRAEEENLRKMNVAAEIYITQNIGIYYNDIMKSDDTSDFASCRSILAWMNSLDYTKGNGTKISRSGIIKLYLEEHPDHFVNGIWQAYNFPIFIDFLADKLTDKAFVNSRAKAQQFKASLMNRDWFTKAVTVAGIRLLNDLHDKRALSSRKAREAISLQKTLHDLIDKTGRIIGKSTKNHDAYYLKEELQDVVISSIKNAQSHIRQMLEGNDEEVKIFHEFEDIYHISLENVRTKLITA